MSIDDRSVHRRPVDYLRDGTAHADAVFLLTAMRSNDLRHLEARLGELAREPARMFAATTFLAVLGGSMTKVLDAVVPGGGADFLAALGLAGARREFDPPPDQQPLGPPIEPLGPEGWCRGLSRVEGTGA